MFIFSIVYSTNSNFKFDDEDNDEVETLAPEKQKLTISIDSKKRAGKTVTLIKGFIGKEEDMESLSKKIKTCCGTGGSAKEGEIIIQGNFKDKIFIFLSNLKYNVKIK